MPKVRVPLYNSIESRDSTLDKDSIISNAFIETAVSGQIVTKRPGLEAKTSALGIGRDSFWYNGNLYSWNSTGSFYLWSGFLTDGTNLMLVNYQKNDGSQGNLILNSSDGRWWKAQEQVWSDYMEVLLYTGTTYIVGEPTSNAIYHSTDGITWVVGVSDFPVSGQWIINSSTTGGAAKLGSIICRPDHLLNSVIISTDDGDSWTRTTTSKATSIGAIAANNSRFTTGTHYSTNGTTWTACTNPHYMTSIVWCGSFFIGLDGTHNYYYSINGIAWTTYALGPTGTLWNRVAYSGANVLVFGTNTSGAGWWEYYGLPATTTDGLTWTLGNKLGTENWSLRSLIYFDNLWILQNYNGDGSTSIWRSSDAINWSSYILDPNAFNFTPAIIPLG